VRPKPYTAPPFYPDGKHDDPAFAAVPVRGYYQVRDYTCGFASTLTVLHGLRRYVDPADLYRQLGTDRSGTRQTAIVKALRYHGVSANLRYDLDFAGLGRAIDDGSLIIAYHNRLEHWLVVFGYGRGPDRVLVADSLPGNRSEHAWDEYGPKLGGFGIICRPRRAGSQVRMRA
jgi:ABC-type bacteriocin/lantibiotic exporter with double-glycine peptidase domain